MNISQTNLKLIAETCFTSEIMRDYIGSRSQEELRIHQVIDIIERAPIELTKKAELFGILTENLSLDEKTTAANMYNVYTDAISHYSVSGAVYILSEHYYNEVMDEEISESVIPYLSFSKAMEAVKVAEERLAEYSIEVCWYSLEEWIPDGEGNLIQAYTYYIHDGKIKWFDKYDTEANNGYIMFGDGDLNIPVPFAVGDIVTVDIAPFRPISHAIITSIGDNRDCCCVQAINCQGNDKWEYGAVKHSMLFTNSPMAFNPLYNMDIYDGPLEGDEIVLLKCKEFIGGDEDKGMYLEQHLPNHPCTADIENIMAAYKADSNNEV